MYDLHWYHYIPQFFKYLTTIAFSKTGSLDFIFYDNGEMRYHPTFYTLAKDRFISGSVSQRAVNSKYGTDYRQDTEYRYRYCQDGLFRREPVTNETLTIQEEVGTILLQLPFTGFDVSSFRQLK